MNAAEIAAHWTPTTCPGVVHLGEHVWGSYVIDARTGRVLGMACLYCETRKDR